ncbi:N-acetylmuramoyl-L-alanine amidase AmiD precursor [Providencia rustigianii]|uniref:N-acetylmuramoyl-L-alanine amidase n=1 Tax=Providencia rustigianii TaxID=158850 RepID=A0A379FZM5_9GAMM|nr:N-acetylmuramoyl-L-alanine amidase [Providencia rustigianii]SUC34294.1 N-acetylmuramoyl-L-alanine amidase AmiD precursor [Providencia rustigianii]
MYRAIWISIIFLLVGCSTAPSKTGYFLDQSHPSRNTSERIQYIVLHYTVSDDAHSIKILTKGKVSSHYLIPSQPEQKNGQPVILQLVPERLKAWHAGDSRWQYHHSLNDNSIGIEIVNEGLVRKNGQDIWQPFNDSQIDALIPLLSDIMQRYGIPPENVIGHSDIAPLRKQDPGRAFPWQVLALHGIGAWPDPQTVTKHLAGRQVNAPANVLRLQKALKFYGYAGIPQTGKLDAETKRTLRAFQLHFRPRDIDGLADAETEAIALALIEKYRDMPKFMHVLKSNKPDNSSNQQGD